MSSTSSQGEEWSGASGTSTSSSVEVETRAPLPPKVYPVGYKLQESIVNTTVRQAPDVPEPARDVLTDEQFWLDGKPNVVLIKEHLTNEGRFKKEHLATLFDTAYEVFCAEDNVLIVPAPVNVCGDIHGQYYDLLKLLEIGGDPSNTSYLFLGDYVDRGDFSIEVVILLFCYKVLFPDTFFMLRGNHECRHLSEYFTFKEECEHKYDREIYDTVMDVFDALPLAAIMNNQFFCVHGGLSPDVTCVEDVNQIDRFCEPPSKGPMCDILWADPTEDFSQTSPVEFEPNDTRGTSFSFGYKATVAFLNKNKWLSVIRAHEAQDAGYRMYAKNVKTGFPALITLFSAPNYLTHYNNKGAIMRYENNSMTIKQFTDSPHPYYLPSFMNVFNWSLPFVAEKVAELLLVVLNLVNDEILDKKEASEELRAQMLRKKILAYSRMFSALKSMREQRELSVSLNGLNASGGSVPTAKGKDPEAVKLQLQSVVGVRNLDAINEARPAGVEKVLASKFTSSAGQLKRQASKSAILAMKVGSSNGSSPRSSPPGTPILSPQNSQAGDIIPTIATVEEELPFSASTSNATSTATSTATTPAATPELSRAAFKTTS